MIKGQRGGGEAAYRTFEGLALVWKASTEILGGRDEYEQVFQRLRDEQELVYLLARTKVEVLERRHEGSRVRVLDGARAGEIYWVVERSLRRPSEADPNGEA